MPDFDPADHMEPAPALVGVLRQLPVRSKVTLADGTTVQSVPMDRGPSKVRRFTVVKPGQKREANLTLANTYGTASDAAAAALRKRGGRK